MITHKIAKFAAIATLSTGLVLAGTAQSRAGQEDLLLGSLLGAAAGGGAGYAFGKGKGALIGGIMGLALGAVVSNHLADRSYAAGPVYEGYVPPPPPAYQPQVYQAPGYQGVAYANAGYSQAYCRSYTTSIRVDGRRHPTSGTACRRADGTWRIVN